MTTRIEPKKITGIYGAMVKALSRRMCRTSGSNRSMGRFEK